MAEESNQQSAGTGGQTPESVTQTAHNVQSKKFEASFYSLVSETTADGRIIFRGDIEIFPDRELPELSSPGTMAYAAKALNSGIEYFVLLCGRSEVPRVTVLGSYRNIKSKNILHLVSAGVVDWPLAERQRYALIFEKPGGKKVLSSPEDKIKTIPDDKIISTVIEPIAAVLENLKNIDLVHGAICLENMFLTSVEGGDSLVLGECLSSAPSYHQHAIYETPSRAMADPVGRGVGTHKDDLYALGICVVMLVKGKNYLKEKTVEEIIAQKIKHGSYGMMVGKERLPAGISEFLRGVLIDDPEQRWDIESVIGWLEGRRLTPKQPPIILNSARPFLFKSKEYFDLKLLANAFADNVVAAVSEIEKDQFVLWVKRNFDDKVLKARLDKVIEREENSSKERMVSAVCSAIDPWGPVRYKGVSLFPGGFGTSLGRAVNDGDDIQVFAEIVMYQICLNWITEVSNELFDSAGLSLIFEKCRMALNQKSLGYGMERVLYISNTEISCMSSMLNKYYVLIPANLLVALEDISKTIDLSTPILDRHMVAFVSIREPRAIDQYLGGINSTDPARKIKGVLRALAEIQKRFAMGPVPGLSKWIAVQLQPAIESFKDKDLRQEVIRQVNRVQNTGDLVEMVNLVDDGWVIEEDNRRFTQARNEYLILEHEKQDIIMYIHRRKNFGRATGRQISMIVSSLVSILIIAAYTFINFYSKL